MKHPMTVKLLVAGVCALGVAAVAQSDNGAATMNQENQGSQAAPSQSETPSQSATPTTDPAANPSGYDTDSATPSRPMTASQKKQSIENIKKAIRDAETDQGRVSGEEGTSATGAMGSKDTRVGVRHLRVFRRGDKVILRGTVRSQEEKDRVGNAAEGAAMGESIDNELKVK